MSNKTYYPGYVAQTTGGKYKTFDNKDNIKTASGYAECHVGGKSASLNRPSTIIVNRFNANIPNGAMITKVTVRYKHSKAKYNNKDCNVQAPTISLLNGDSVIRYGNGNKMQRKGKAPTPTATESKIDFNSTIFNLSVINSNNFKVKVDYPTNANDNEGYVRLYYVKVIIEWTTSSYGLSIKHVEGEYNGDRYFITVDISNKKLTKYKPTITLTVEDGFSFVSHYPTPIHDVSYANYTFTMVNATTFRIVPDFSKKAGACTVTLLFDSHFTYATGVSYHDALFKISESLNGVSNQRYVRVTKDRPVDPSVDPDTGDQKYDYEPKDGPETIHTITIDEAFDYTLSIEDDTWDDLIQTIYNWGIEHDHWSEPLEEVYDTILSRFMVRFGGEIDLYDGTSFSKNHCIHANRGSREDPEFQDIYLSNWFSTLDENDRQWPMQLKGVTVGYDEVYGVIDSAYYDDDWENYCFSTWKFVIRPKEEDLTTPFLALLSPTPEELHRLGNGYNYTVQSFLKEVTSETYVRDWYKNFRIGIFNNPIWENITYVEEVDPETGETIEVPEDSTNYNTLTYSEIFNNAEYWSNPVTTVNAFENLNCTFTYNKDYPLHILLVGDYMEATTQASIKYTEPVIVESEVFKDYEENGVYPVPIEDLVLSDGSSAELTIGALNNASPLIFYNWPLDEDYGTNDEIAIRGLEIRGTIESNTDNLIIHASLKNGQQETRQRSLTLDELDNTLTDENQFSIGGIGDLWGFSTLDIINLEDWEAHLTISNILNDTTGGINFRDIQLVIYIENIENQLVKTYIEGQDVSYYGAFLTELKIPEGLKTDTAYLDIDGTDINDPYRQNIKEKTIEATFDIGDCDIEGSTLSLREFTRLLVNERDQYNKPIPKRIEFSHYPDVYWEYILEDTFDNDLEISTYNVKVKLVIPAGTSYDKITTKTNDVGYVSGLAHVRPTIQFKPSSTLIAIREDVTQQEFHMSYTEEWLGKVIEIDCDNRIVLLKEDDDDTDGENITNYVDFSSDWFTILGEYQFQTVGCAIMSIEYQERW